MTLIQAAPILIIIIGILATYYITDVLKFDELTDQPFEGDQKIKFMQFVDKMNAEGAFEDYDLAEIEYNAGLFDYFRAFFGLYDRSGEVWVVNEKRLPMWRCPKCLSFWVSIPVSVVVTVMTNADPSFLILLIPAFSGGSWFLFTFRDN